METRASVCLAVFEGERFIKQQVDSIVSQLGPTDELIISDDNSTDATIEVLDRYRRDIRVKLLKNEGPSGVVRNFENALQRSQGEYIFLADQDDVWHPEKINKMLEALQECDLAVSDCVVVDEELATISDSFFQLNHSGKGLMRNLFKNSYIGCCMALKRKVLEKSIPFPANIPMHDMWFGLVAERLFKVYFMPDKLVYYRRHDSNASVLQSRSSLWKRLEIRLKVLKDLYAIKNG